MMCGSLSGATRIIVAPGGGDNSPEMGVRHPEGGSVQEMKHPPVAKEHPLKTSIQTASALLVGTLLSFSVMAYTRSSEAPSNPPVGPTQEDSCYDRPDGFTCCSCGSGKTCCVKIGPLIESTPG
jgi:hypothetical protein